MEILGEGGSGLSPSDSGRLIQARGRRSPGSSIGGSGIDLQRESGYRVPKKAAAKIEAAKKRKVVPLAGSAAAKANNSQAISLAQTVAETHPGLANTRKKKERNQQYKTYILIVIAAVIGFGVSRLVPSQSGGSSDSQQTENQDGANTDVVESQDSDADSAT